MTLSHRIRKQSYEGGFSEQFNDIFEVFRHIIKAIFVWAFLDNYFFGRAMTFFIFWILALQIMVHLPLIAIGVPANVMDFLIHCFSIANFDYMPTYFIEKLYFYDYDEQEKHDSEIIDQTKDLNYKNHNWLTNTRFIGFLLIVYFIKLILMIFCCKPLSHSRRHLCPYRWIGRFYPKYWLSLVWTEILTLLIAQYPIQPL